MTENEVKDYIRIHYDDIMKKHTKCSGPYTINPEYPLECGLAADFAILGPSGEVCALIECKRGVGTAKSKTLGLHELVMGLGQVEQYNNHLANNMYSLSSASMCNNEAKCFLVTDNGIKDRFKWDKLAYSKGVNLLLIDDVSKQTEEYSLYNQRDLKRLVSIAQSIEVMPCPIFTKEGHLAEYYMALKAINEESKKVNYNVKLNRSKIVGDVLKKYAKKSEPRNTNITLSNLNYINTENHLTVEGVQAIQKSYKSFAKDMVYNKLSIYFVNVMTALMRIAQKKAEPWEDISASSKEIKQEILMMYDGKKVTNLTTDNQERYVTSILSMLKDDLKAIDKIKRNHYKINYLPFKELDSDGKLDNALEVPSYLEKYLNDNGLPGMF